MSTLSITLIRFAIVLALAVGMLPGCGDAEQAKEDAMDKEVQRIAKQVAEDFVKQEAKKLAADAAKNLKAEKTPLKELSRKAFLETIRGQGKSEAEAARLWSENEARTKKEFIDRMTKEKGVPAEQAEALWEHGE